MLGLGGYAEGGIVGNQFYEDGHTPYSAGLPDGKGQKTDIHVEVQLSPNFEVSGKEESEEDVMDVIRRHLKEMADEVGGQIATNLEAVFSNMPLSEGA